MQFLTFFHHFLLLFTIPALVVYPEATLPDFQTPHQNVLAEGSKKYAELKHEAFSYDDVLDLLEEIEEGHIDERCTPEEIDGINRFIALLAKQGIFPGDLREEFLIQKDIEILLSPQESSWTYSYGIEGGYAIQSALFFGQANGLLCRSWFKKQWDRTRNFVKDHKTAILIGAAVVVAVVITVGVVAAVASAGTAVAVGATDSALSSIPSDNFSQSDSRDNYGPSMHSEPEAQVLEPVIPLLEALVVKDVIDEQVNTFKEPLLMEFIIAPERSSNVFPNSLSDSAREFGAALAHKIFDSASEIVSVAPKLLEEIRDVSERLIPSGLRELHLGEEYNPVGHYKCTIDNGHKAIDQFFGTLPLQENVFKFDLSPDVSYGFLPPPGSLGAIVSSEGRIGVTQASSTCGWRVGQPIQNRTFWGGIPKWSTVRSRYWKNKAIEAKSNQGSYSEANIQRMERGFAPLELNQDTGLFESVELHHTPPQREGGLFDFIEVTPSEHARIDGY
ncbi:MAG TPA: hypothetical protein VGO47_12050, partial [Chlamydiales bacterium]|nr:hypothetical protein [Chlamydiales bacterium]